MLASALFFFSFSFSFIGEFLEVVWEEWYISLFPGTKKRLLKLLADVCLFVGLLTGFEVAEVKKKKKNVEANDCMNLKLTASTWVAVKTSSFWFNSGKNDMHVYNHVTSDLTPWSCLR